MNEAKNSMLVLFIGAMLGGALCNLFVFGYQSKALAQYESIGNTGPATGIVDFGNGWTVNTNSGAFVCAYNSATRSSLASNGTLTVATGAFSMLDLPEIAAPGTPPNNHVFVYNDIATDDPTVKFDDGATFAWATHP